MSGGHFNYQDENLKEEIFGYTESRETNPLNDLELSELVWDVLTLLHDYDWYASGDTGKENWDASRATFKSKWLQGRQKERLEQLIDERLQRVKDELKEML